MKASVFRMEGMLETIFIRLVSQSFKESASTINSLSTDSGVLWEDFRKRLKSLGISPGLLSQHKDHIISLIEGLISQPQDKIKAQTGKR